MFRNRKIPLLEAKLFTVEGLQMDAGKVRIAADSPILQVLT